MLVNNVLHLRGGMSPLLLLLSTVVVIVVAVQPFSTTTAAPSQHQLGAGQLQMIQNVNLYLINLGLQLDYPLQAAPNKPAAAAAASKRPQQAVQVTASQLGQSKAIELALREASQEVGLIRDGILIEEQSHDRFKLLFSDANLIELAQFLNTLSVTTCDQVTLDFLMIVANYIDQQQKQKKKGTSSTSSSDQLIVQKYAKLKVQLCWQRFVASVSRQIDALLGKMNVPVFKHIEHLADKIQTAKEGRATVNPVPKSRDSIKIDDSNAMQEAKAVNFAQLDAVTSSLDASADKLGQAIGALKAVELASLDQRRDFALAINQLFNEHSKLQQKLREGDGGGGGVGAGHEGWSWGGGKRAAIVAQVDTFYEDFFLKPCDELTRRIRSVVSSGDIFKSHITTTLGVALANEKQTNQRLDYELQVYRVCKINKDNSQDIKQLLARMR